MASDLGDALGGAMIARMMQQAGVLGQAYPISHRVYFPKCNNITFQFVLSWERKQMIQTDVACTRELWERPASQGRADADAGVLSTIADADRGIAIWQRSVDTVVHPQAAAFAAGECADLRLSLTPAQLEHDLIPLITANLTPMRPTPAIHTPSLAAPFALGSSGDAVQQASSLVDLTRIFASEPQVCVHPRPASPDMLGALESLQTSGWSGLRAVAGLAADGVPAIDALPLPPPVAHPALARRSGTNLSFYASWD